MLYTKQLQLNDHHILLIISQIRESNRLNSAKTPNTLVMILYILGLILDKVPSILKMMIPTGHVQIMENKDFGSNYIYSNATYLTFRYRRVRQGRTCVWNAEEGYNLTMFRSGWFQVKGGKHRVRVRCIQTRRCPTNFKYLDGGFYRRNHVIWFHKKVKMKRFNLIILLSVIFTLSVSSCEIFIPRIFNENR